MHSDFLQLVGVLMELISTMFHGCDGTLGHLNGLYGRADKVTKEIDTFLELVIQEHVEERERNGGGKVTGESRCDFVDVFASNSERRSCWFSTS